MQSSCVINTTNLICKIIHSSHFVLCKSSYVTIKTVAVNRYLKNGLCADFTEQECHCNLTRPSLPCGSGPARVGLGWGRAGLGYVGSRVVRYQVLDYILQY